MLRFNTVIYKQNNNNVVWYAKEKKSLRKLFCVVFFSCLEELFQCFFLKGSETSERLTCLWAFQNVLIFFVIMEKDIIIFIIMCVRFSGSHTHPLTGTKEK
jgi:hypothetical protein